MDITTILAPYLAGVTAMAGLIVPVTTFIRKHVLTRMDGWEVVAFTVVLGNVFTLAGVFTHVVTWNVLQGVAFGTFSGLYSAGLVAALKGSVGTIVAAIMGVLKGALPEGTAPKDSGTPNSSTPSQG